MSPLPAIDKSRLSHAAVTPLGDVFVWTGPSEIAMLHFWGTGQPFPPNSDKLYNPELVVPHRPTISNMQWISGTQYITPTDLDLLIGGPDRPPSKRMQVATAAQERDARLGTIGTARAQHSAADAEGWGDYMARQLNERTEKLNILGDSMDRLQENSQGWAEDASKYVAKQKRNFLLGSVKSSFGL